MMDYWDIACIVFACTAANHLGPIPDIEAFVGRKLPVVGCIKCLTFWAVLIYCCGKTATHSAPAVLAISFLSAWAAIWLDLVMGMIDGLYLKIYDTFYSATDETDADALGAPDTVPDVQEKESSDGTASGWED